MIVRVDVDKRHVHVLEPEVLNRFHVSATAGVDAVLPVLGERGRPAEKANHLWLEIAWVRGLAEGQVDAGWHEGFNKMIEFARTHGWVDEAGTHVMAHVEVDA